MRLSVQEELEESDDDEGEGDGAEYRSISVGTTSDEIQHSFPLVTFANCMQTFRPGKQPIDDSKQLYNSIYAVISKKST